MAKGQRAQKHTPECEAHILAALRAGATYETAAACGGVSADTLARWRRRYPAFGDAATRAQATAEVHLLAQVSAAKDWRAAAWWLERRYPERYGRSRAKAPSREEAAPRDVRVIVIDH